MVARDGIEPPTPAFSGLRPFLRGAAPPRECFARYGRSAPLTPTADSPLGKNDGGQGRNRTADASLFRAALYRLSYLAILIDDCRWDLRLPSRLHRIISTA